ncbi:MAG: YHS domain-containing protein [Actinomycetes bacterium]
MKMKVVDLVCKMEIESATAADTYEYQGEKYYFCMTGCKTAFAADPTKFLPKKKGFSFFKKG